MWFGYIWTNTVEERCFRSFGFNVWKCSLTNRSKWLKLTALVSKYQIYDEDCLGISSIRSLLSSLSSLLTRPTMAEVMVDTAILAKQATSAMATLAAANPPSSQWQPPSASIITVFFQPNRKYLGKQDVKRWKFCLFHLEKPLKFAWRTKGQKTKACWFFCVDTYPAARPPTTEPKSQELKVMAMSMRK